MVRPLVFHRVMDATSAQGWQVRQTSTGIDLLLAGSPDGDLLERVEQNVNSALLASGVVCEVEIVAVSNIPKEISGKTPLIKALAGSRRRIEP